MIDLKQHIRTIPDFPSPGILFYDISTLLLHATAWKEAMDRMVRLIAPHTPDLVAGIESRGFLVASPLALELGVGQIMIRKPGKLPGSTISVEYEKEYGRDRLEIPADLIKPGQRVVVVDDLLATGGSLNAAVELLCKAGAVVPGAACILELAALGGREKISVPVDALVSVE